MFTGGIGVNTAEIRQRLAEAFAQAMPALSIGMYPHAALPAASASEDEYPANTPHFQGDWDPTSALPLDTEEKFSKLLRYLRQRLPQMQQQLLEAHGCVPPSLVHVPSC